jgi:rSAM/selenodomain-associated transferase 2
MLSIIIPTLNAEASLPQTLSALIQGVVSGLVKDVVVSDGGSADASGEIAENAGCTVVTGPAGRGAQLARGAKCARGDWLLFLHADTVLSTGWEEEIGHFVAQNYSRNYAGVFRFALDDFRPRARRLEFLVALRCRLFALPYGDQGLLIHRNLYDQIGGFANAPLMEDVDIIRRIGRKRIVYFRSTALTSAVRYMAGGYLRRPLRNLFCLSLYFLRVPPHLIARLYG